MNGKKAKELRRQAKLKATGMADIAYVHDKLARTTKRLWPECARAVYQQQKRQK